MQDLTYRVVIGLCRALFRAFGLRITVSGAERLPAAGAVVVAANHSSFLDFMFVGLVGVRRGRLVRFMAKESVFRSRLSGPLMRAMSHLPVDRAHGELAARQAHRALWAGEVVGVYPEATIGRAFVVKDREDFRRGAAYLAIATGAPLVPVAHWGIHRIFTVDGRYSLRRGKAVEVVVGEPLVPLAGETAEALTVRLHDRLAEMVDELVERYPQPPADPVNAWWWPASRGGAAPTLTVARALDEAAVSKADTRR
ncbi:lysophospholipid acyltransferase family protein [Pedococcus bigeumensis]|uniref:1-acyl-sn-glycerol-3-phosphate acyltransferase n=1 Tax=Pedococcus bigeumensis TaxID=433644 RepID=A0A502CZX6_9MICO|nr:lysophospholipid acyltransferase family protein [Pedococcus bigeumensis]TPG17311.1 1-acyl-sn-glycerol-3-phosphate acyltransferase [Pedococcus bigeumensis]